MRLDVAGTVVLVFARSHTELRVALDDAPAQLKRATEVLGQWRGHEQQIAMVDMTTPGQAVMRLRAPMPRGARCGVRPAHSPQPHPPPRRLGASPGGSR